MKVFYGRFVADVVAAVIAVVTLAIVAAAVNHVLPGILPTINVYCVGSDLAINNAYYLWSRGSLGASDYKGPLFSSAFNLLALMIVSWFSSHCY